MILMTNIIRFPHQELKLKRRHLKRQLKSKTITLFLSPPANPTNFTKNLLQTPACKRSKQDLIKMGYSKINEYLNQEKTSKMKEIAKRHHEGDQGSPSEKRKIKC